MALSKTGQPFIGYVSLTNAAPGPVVFTLYALMGQPAYTLGASYVEGSQTIQAERCYITNIALSSNDASQALVTIDTGGATPTKIASQYLSNVQPPGLEQVPPGVLRCIPGVVPRATASAVSAGKTVECLIKGYISRS